MSTRRNLMTVCFAAVFALGLAACSSSDDEAMTPTTMPDPVDPPAPAGPTVAELFTTAQTSSDDAAAAATAASDAVKAAMEAQNKLGTMNAAGESMTEYTNAKAIMDARDAAVQAVMDAEAALEAANGAKTHAEALDDSAQKTALLSALNQAIEDAEGAIEDATDARDGDDLKAAVDAVTGGDNADPQGTPGSLAKAVAMAVGEALGGETVAAEIPRGSIDAAPDAAVMDAIVRMNDHQGKTWAEIVGEDNLIEERVGTDNVNVKLGSIAGMTAATVNAALTATGGVDGGNTYADGASQDTSTYKGIPGTAYCLGSDCEVDSDGKLKGSWYFTPTSPMEFYITNPDATAREATPYVAETLYARFGHWLTVDATTGVVTINRYATAVGNTAGLTFVKATGMPDSATYNGDAVGMSVHKETDTDGVVTSIDSGAFTADVELLLRFGDGADVTLGGTIDGFEGNAVDSNWTVELERRIFTDTGAGTGTAGAFLGTDAASTGKAVASGRDGQWTAQAYGATGERPTGIIGTFNAHFSDGHAAGAYATRK